MTRGSEMASQIKVRLDGVCDQTWAAFEDRLGRDAVGDLAGASRDDSVGVTDRFVGDAVGSGKALG